VLSLFDADLIPSELDEWMKKLRIMYKKDRGNKRLRAKYDLLKGIGFLFDSLNVLSMVQYVKAKKIMNDNAAKIRRVFAKSLCQKSLLEVFAKSCKIRLILEKVNHVRGQNVVRVENFEYCCKMRRFKDR